VATALVHECALDAVEVLARPCREPQDLIPGWHLAIEPGSFVAAVPNAGPRVPSAACPFKLLDDGSQRRHEPLAASFRKRIEHARIDTARDRLCGLKRVSAFAGQAQLVGAGVGPAAAPLNESLLHQSPHDLGRGAAIDPGLFRNVGLTCPFTIGDHHKD
jgi:hypothetical protein